VGSILKYNITLRSEKELHDVLLGLVIEDPNGDIIHEKEYSFDEILVDEKISLTSETENGEWDLIYLTTPGTYTLSLNLSNPPEVDLFVQETYAYRHDTWLPFYFEVLTSQDRIIMQQNEDMMRATKNTFIASLVMLFVSLTALVSTKSGRRSLSVLITFGILLLIILSIGYLLYLGHLGAI